MFLTSESVQAQSTPAAEPVVKAVQKVRPAVVNIYTETQVTRKVSDPFDLFFDRYFNGQGGVRGGRIVTVPVRSLGSGVIISADGYIITNQHVVARAAGSGGAKTTIKITLPDEEQDFEAELLQEDRERDLALLKIKGTKGKKFPFLNINKISPNLLGQTVIAIGNPVGYESSVSRGILSAKERSITIGGITYDNLMQTDAAINPGNSGGPLIDISGKFMGINAAKMNRGRGGVVIENIGFVIPGEIVAAFAKHSIDIAEGRVIEAPKTDILALISKHYGLHLQEINQDLADEFGFQKGSGLLVIKVDPGSPAEAAGLKKGMLVLSIGPHRSRGISDLPRSLLKIKTGTELKFAIVIQQRKAGILFTRRGTVPLKAK